MINSTFTISNGQSYSILINLRLKFVELKFDPVDESKLT